MKRREIRSIDQDFIKTYQRLPVLWDTKHPEYSNKYIRGFASDTLLKILKKWDKKATRINVRQKINTLRSFYRKILRKHLASKRISPDGKEFFEYTSKNWKFHALRFLDGKSDKGDDRIENSDNNGIVEITLDNVHFENDEETSESSGNNTQSTQADILQTFSEDESGKERNEYEESKIEKCVKVKLLDYIVDGNLLDRELEAITSNVTYKLMRMNPEQRCHAELLINKVLIEGLKNNLTDDTDLTQVYK